MIRALLTKILRQVTKTNPDLNEVIERCYSDIDLIDFLIEPILSQTDEQELGRIGETLNQEERNQLIELPYNLVFHQTIETIQLDEESLIELNNYLRPLNEFKYPGLFSLLYFISIDKVYSMDKENHGFGYHFHLYEKTSRTDTLLSFNPKESPNKKTYKNYLTFEHSLFYERHAKQNKRVMTDLNSKAQDFREKVYNECLKIVLNKIEKIHFKGPDKSALVLSK